MFGCPVSAEAGHAVVTVRDSGVGFDEEFADKLFDPFTQEEQVQLRSHVGAPITARAVG